MSHIFTELAANPNKSLFYEHEDGALEPVAHFTVNPVKLDDEFEAVQILLELGKNDLQEPVQVSDIVDKVNAKGGNVTEVILNGYTNTAFEEDVTYHTAFLKDDQQIIILQDDVAPQDDDYLSQHDVQW